MLVLFSNLLLNSDKCKYSLSSDALTVHKTFFDKKSQEIALLKEEGKYNSISNLSKIRDQVLRVAVVFQVIEKSLEFLCCS